MSLKVFFQLIMKVPLSCHLPFLRHLLLSLPVSTLRLSPCTLSARGFPADNSCAYAVVSTSLWGSQHRALTWLLASQPDRLSDSPHSLKPIYGNFKVATGSFPFFLLTCVTVIPYKVLRLVTFLLKSLKSPSSWPGIRLSIYFFPSWVFIFNQVNLFTNTQIWYDFIKMH